MGKQKAHSTKLGKKTEKIERSEVKIGERYEGYFYLVVWSASALYAIYSLFLKMKGLYS